MLLEDIRNCFICGARFLLSNTDTDTVILLKLKIYRILTIFVSFIFGQWYTTILCQSYVSGL